MKKIKKVMSVGVGYIDGGGSPLYDKLNPEFPEFEENILEIAYKILEKLEFKLGKNILNNNTCNNIIDLMIGDSHMPAHISIEFVEDNMKYNISFNGYCKNNNEYLVEKIQE